MGATLCSPSTDRVCKKCGAAKPLDAFCVDKRMRGGHSNVCLVCYREYPSVRAARDSAARARAEMFRCRSCHMPTKWGGFHVCHRRGTP